jgi:transcriptional regulator with XRE-family HTH domain
MNDKIFSARLIFAKNLRKLRQSRSLSQEKLAELSGLHRTYIGSVERGERNISIDNMERIAMALHVEIPDLLKRTDS